MINTSKLRGKMTEEGKNYNECARALGVSTTTFSNKINNKYSFTVEEAGRLATFLNLTKEERIEIFLPLNLHNVQVKECIPIK